MKNVVIIAVVVLIVLCAGLYVWRAKKSGKKCIGCPSASSCHKNDCSCCNTDKQH